MKDTSAMKNRLSPSAPKLRVSVSFRYSRADGEDRRTDYRSGGKAVPLFVVLHAEDDQRADNGRQE